MITWKEFVQNRKDTDFSQIESVYKKSHIAVDLVRWYNPELLNNISTIANLASGAYGVYMSGENKKTLPPEVQKQLIYYGRLNPKNIGNLPEKTIKQYYPNLTDQQIKQDDTIHVNVNRIISEKDTDLEAILEIASTIVHEATHEIERETTGMTSEIGPKNAENQFIQWATKNIKGILNKFPEIGQNTLNKVGISNPNFIKPQQFNFGNVTTQI